MNRFNDLPSDRRSAKGQGVLNLVSTFFENSPKPDKEKERGADPAAAQHSAQRARKELQYE